MPSLFARGSNRNAGVKLEPLFRVIVRLVFMVRIGESGGTLVPHGRQAAGFRQAWGCICRGGGGAGGEILPALRNLLRSLTRLHVSGRRRMVRATMAVLPAFRFADINRPEDDASDDEDERGADDERIPRAGATGDRH